MGHWVVELASGGRICVEARTGRQAEREVEAWVVSTIRPKVIFTPDDLACRFPDLDAALTHSTPLELRHWRRQAELAQSTAVWIERQLAAPRPHDPERLQRAMSILVRSGGAIDCRYPKAEPLRPSRD